MNEAVEFGPKKPHRRCQVCSLPHDDLAQLNHALVCGVQQKALAERFGLTESAVSNHKRNHLSAAERAAMLSDTLKPGIELEKIIQDEGGGVVQKLAALRNRLWHSLDVAQSYNDHHSVAVLSSRILESLQLTAKLTGELAAYASAKSTKSITNIAIISSPEFNSMIREMIGVLQPYPAARQAILDYVRHAGPQEGAIETKVIEHQPVPAETVTEQWRKALS